ncbi:MAG: YegS/Rv2252/BmrU family lipid kinase [Oscillospiraceae bacterium]|nr:YegS/Rv2252/BmrU family lipid kinase [Oscillospiraceae bacterium]
MRHIFIINPKAGKKKGAKLLEENIRKLDVPYEIVYTKQAGDAHRIAQEAAEGGDEVRIYACGGDGTLNEVVNGAAGYGNAAVTNVPLGTGNDFLKLFGKENKARFTDLKALSEGPQAAMDLIDCNGHLGLNTVCAGLDARIAADKDKYNGLPLVSGIGAYAISAVANALFKSISQPMTVDMGDFHYEGEGTIICVCSGRYYGGGFMPVGDNMPDDGLLETLVVRKVSRLTFFRLIGEYGKGRYAKYPDLIQYDQGDGVTVRSPQELVAAVDGEILRSHELNIRLSDKKINFFYPAGLNYEPKV